MWHYILGIQMNKKNLYSKWHIVVVIGESLISNYAM